MKMAPLLNFWLKIFVCAICFLLEPNLHESISPKHRRSLDWNFNYKIIKICHVKAKDKIRPDSFSIRERMSTEKDPIT